MGKIDDGWPRSPFRAAMHPHCPIFQTFPLWRGQFALMNKVAANVNCPPADVVAFAALAFVEQFRTREELLKALDNARTRFALNGSTPRLRFPLEWPDTPAGRSGEKHSDSV